MGVGMKPAMARAATIIALLLASQPYCANAAKEPPPRRAKPPVWTPDVLDVFFEDAREHLVGDRPQPTGFPANAQTKPVASPSEANSSQPFAWSRIVSGEALEAEVKRLTVALREPLANQAKFKAGGYKDCRAHFSVLAVLFAVVAEHDGEVRWKEDAAMLRDSLARAAMNCKTATDQTFAEAAQRRVELEDLVRGQGLGGADATELEKWSDLAERPLLMQRMEILLQEEILPVLGNRPGFERRADEIRQKAELLAMLADVMQREEYEYWDDAGFQELATELRTATAELTKAAADANYEAVRAAAGRTSQACSQCHEGYRG
jgi:hypothetical protein